MPEQVGPKRAVTHKQDYDIQLRIKDQDYSADIFQVRVASSIFTSYQIVSLSVFLDPQDVILRNVFGKEPLKLQIRLLGPSGQQSDNIELELMYVSSDIKVPMKPPMNDRGMKERISYSILCVTRQPFKTMTTFVNDIYENKTIKEIIEDLCSKTGAKLIIDSEGINEEKIEQVLIPPTTLYKTIQYLDSTFGIYNGLSNYGGFCQYDNKVYVMNLSARMNKAQTFTMYQLAAAGHDDKIVDKVSDGKTFYTYEPITTDYSGNAKFAREAKQIVHVVKPTDKLFLNIEHDLDKICSDYGLISKSKNIAFDSELNSRKSYRTGDMGSESSETFAISKLTKKIGSLSNVKIMIEKSLPVTKLINVGEPVKLISRNLNTMELSGMYILKSSDITLLKKGAWEATAEVNLMRSNKLI
jgi:hypothetical protein